MIRDKEVVAKIRPIILAGGLGTRLRPRTNYLPKPLLPVKGRPILWYALDSICGMGMLPPIITLDYKGDLIRAYFENENIKFWDLPDRTMAEAVFEVSEKDNAEAFLGMSADVLIPRRAVAQILDDYSKNYQQNTVLFVKLPKPGHKKWNFIIKDKHLIDIEKKEIETNLERVLLIMTKKSLLEIRKILIKPVIKENVPDNWKEFQTGWILILKAMALTGIEVHARFVDIPICNINVPIDFKITEEFVNKYMH